MKRTGWEAILGSFRKPACPNLPKSLNEISKLYESGEQMRQVIRSKHAVLEIKPHAAGATTVINVQKHNISIVNYLDLPKMLFKSLIKVDTGLSCLFSHVLKCL